MCISHTWSSEAMSGLGWSLWAGLRWIWCQAHWVDRVATWKVMMMTWAMAAHAWSQDSYLKSVWESLAQLEQPWTQDAFKMFDSQGFGGQTLDRGLNIGTFPQLVHFYVEKVYLTSVLWCIKETQAQVDLRCERYHGELSPGLGCLTIWRFQKLVVESWK